VNGEYVMTATMAGLLGLGLNHEVNNVIRLTRVMLEVSLNPDPSQLPGGGTLSDLMNGLAGFGLILAVGVFAFGGAQWALGNATSNLSWAERGKQAVVVAAMAALLIGAAAIIVNFFFGIGRGLH
jgi:Family of unknown function (DUF6112)